MKARISQGADRRPAPESRASAEAPEGTPLYLHLPFCVSRCHYCDFYSVVAEGQDLDGAIEALLAEARVRAPSRPRTVFFGGGTPSLFGEEQLRRLFDGLQDLTGFRESASEVSIECNPESLDGRKASLLLDLGASRLTLGIQSLREETLRLFGRAHRAEDALRAFGEARAAGVSELGVDLIFAAPGHDLETWRDDLGRVLDLGPEHVSAYGLAFEEETPFSRWLADGRLERLPEELELGLFLETRARLQARGYEAYETSNFALPGRQCEHNLNYWRNGPYIGLGPSAASHLGRRRWGNARDLEAWRAAIAAGRSAAAWSEELEPRASLGETWWLGLRLSAGVEAARAREVAGWPAAEDPAEELARRLVAEGLLEREGEGYRLSAAGLPLADRVSAEFLA